MQLRTNPPTKTIDTKELLTIELRGISQMLRKERRLAHNDDFSIPAEELAAVLLGNPRQPDSSNVLIRIKNLRVILDEFESRIVAS